MDTTHLNGLIVDCVTDARGTTELRLCPESLASQRVLAGTTMRDSSTV